MKFYPDVFDILDYQHENDNHLNEKQQRTKIEAEFNLNYQFDNTLSNIVGDEEEQEFIGNESINTSDNDDDDDDEVKDQSIDLISMNYVSYFFRYVKNEFYHND
jgi:hypothetical protein